MDNILEPNDQFDFSLISLGQPATLMFSKELLTNILTDVNVHKYIRPAYINTLPTTPNLQAAAWIYNKDAASYTDTNYFTEYLKFTTAGDPTNISNTGNIPAAYLDQSAQTTYWSSGFWIFQKSDRSQFLPNLVTFIGLNGQYLIMDIVTQLVTAEFSSNVDDVPGFISKGKNQYYGGSSGNNGCLNAVNIKFIGYNTELPQIGYDITANPYVKSTNSTITAVQQGSYTLNLASRLVADALMYAESIYPNTLSSATLPGYSGLLKFTQFSANTKGNYPLSSPPYFDSSPLTLLTASDSIYSVIGGTGGSTGSTYYGSASYGNPYALLASSFFINDIYDNVLLNFGTLN
jgi:hypothetical protein